MYIRKRVKKKRHFSKKHKILLLVLLGVVACLGTILFNKVVNDTRYPVVSSAPEPDHELRTVGGLEPTTKNRTIYPYSVIPGGVRDRDELATHISNDPVVNTHYKNFRVLLARLMRAPKARQVHVSYRLGNRVYWTAKTVRIPEGEILITDGNEVARTRCGNLISEDPKEPVSPEEPPIEVLETPIEKVDTIQLEKFADTSWQPQEVDPMDPFVPIPDPAIIHPYVPPKMTTILPRYYHPPRFRIPFHHIIVSEPGSLILIIAGLTVLLVLRLTWKN